MGERFYLAQIAAIGTCPGINPKKRRKRMAWEEEKKQRAIDMYLAKEPTPETSIEVVKEVAEELNETVNGVRMILTKAEVYIKKAPAAKSGSGGSGSGSGSSSGGGRVSKEDAQNSLREAITDAGQTVDDDIIVKLTGKAAVYLASVIVGANTADA